MAETYAGRVSTVRKWTAAFQSEFVRTGPFRRFMSSNNDNIIIVNDTDLKGEGDSVDFPFVMALRGDGVTGNTQLAGRGEAGQADSHRIFIDWRRNSTPITKKEQKNTAYDQLQAYRAALKTWGQEKLKFDIIAALCSVGYEVSTTSLSVINHNWWNYIYPNDGVTTTPGSTGYSAATQRNNWAVYNTTGRVLYGKTQANFSGVNATDIAKIDTTDDVMTYSICDLAKLMAQDESLNPRIYPYTGNAEKGTDETFVMFHHPIAFQKLRDSLGTFLSNAEVRGRDNPLFAAGDIYWNGVLHTTVPGLPTLGTVGGSSSTVVPSFLCGKGSLGLAWGQLPLPTSETTDLGFRTEIGIEMQYGVEKLLYWNSTNSHKVQMMITVFTSAGY